MNQRLTRQLSMQMVMQIACTTRCKSQCKTTDPSWASSRDNAVAQSASAWQDQCDQSSRMSTSAADANRLSTQCGQKLIHCCFDATGIHKPERTQPGPF